MNLVKVVLQLSLEQLDSGLNSVPFPEGTCLRDMMYSCQIIPCPVFFSCYHFPSPVWHFFLPGATSFALPVWFDFLTLPRKPIFLGGLRSQLAATFELHETQVKLSPWNKVAAIWWNHCNETVVNIQETLGVNRDQKAVFLQMGPFFTFCFFQNVHCNDLLKTWTTPCCFEVQAVFNFFFSFPPSDLTCWAPLESGINNKYYCRASLFFP